MIERVGRQVDRELGRLGPAGAIAAVVAAWPAAVGEAIARNAWPARLAGDGTMHVSTSSSAWAFELGQLAPTVLDQLRSALGESAPRALRFAVGRLPEPGRPDDESKPEATVFPDARDRAAAASLAAAIEDPTLRELVSRAAAASLARAASDRRF